MTFDRAHRRRLAHGHARRGARARGAGILVRRTRTADRAFTFGTGKVYALAGYTSAVSLAFVALWMLVEGIVRRLISQPSAVAFGEALPVAALGLAVNLIQSAQLLDHGDQESSAKAHDHNWRAAYFHVMADALTSVLAITALLAGRCLALFVDPMMGLVGGGLILHWAAGLSRAAAGQLLDAVPSVSTSSTACARSWKCSTTCTSPTCISGTWRQDASNLCIVSLVTATPHDTAYYRDLILARWPFAHLTVEVHRCRGGHDLPA